MQESEAEAPRGRKRTTATGIVQQTRTKRRRPQSRAGAALTPSARAAAASDEDAAASLVAAPPPRRRRRRTASTSAPRRGSTAAVAPVAAQLAGLPPVGSALLALVPQPPPVLPLFHARPAAGSTRQDYTQHAIRYGGAPVVAKLCPVPLFVPFPPVAAPADTAPLTTHMSISCAADITTDATSPNPAQKLRAARREPAASPPPEPSCLPPAGSMNRRDSTAMAAAAAAATPLATRRPRPRSSVPSAERQASPAAQRSVSPPAKRSVPAATMDDAQPAASQAGPCHSAPAAVAAAQPATSAPAATPRARPPSHAASVEPADGKVRCKRAPSRITSAKSNEPGLRGWRIKADSEEGVVRLHIALLSMAPTQQVADATGTLAAAADVLLERLAEYGGLVAAGGEGCSEADASAAHRVERAATYAERASRLCMRRRRVEQAMLGLQLGLQAAVQAQETEQVACTAAGAAHAAYVVAAEAAGTAVPAVPADSGGADPCATLMCAMRELVTQTQGWSDREAAALDATPVPAEDAAPARPLDEQMRALAACAADAAAELGRLERVYGSHAVPAYQSEERETSAAGADASQAFSRRRVAANVAAAAAAAEVVASNIPPATRAARSRSKRPRNPGSRCTSVSTEECAPTPEVSGGGTSAPPPPAAGAAQRHCPAPLGPSALSRCARQHTASAEAAWPSCSEAHTDAARLAITAWGRHTPLPPLPSEHKLGQWLLEPADAVAAVSMAAPAAAAPVAAGASSVSEARGSDSACARSCTHAAIHRPAKRPLQPTSQQFALTNLPLDSDSFSGAGDLEKHGIAGAKHVWEQHAAVAAATGSHAPTAR